MFNHFVETSLFAALLLLRLLILLNSTKKKDRTGALSMKQSMLLSRNFEDVQVASLGSCNLWCNVLQCIGMQTAALQMLSFVSFLEHE